MIVTARRGDSMWIGRRGVMWWLTALAGVLLGVQAETPLAAQQAPAPQDMVLIPAGPFVMGSDRVDEDALSKEYGFGKPLYLDEHPRRTVHLPAFYIDKYEVTYAQYRDFVVERNYWVPEVWRRNGYLLTREVLQVADLPTLRHLAANTYRLNLDVRRLDREALLDAIDALRRSWDRLPISEVSWEDARNYCAWAGKRLPTEAEWEKAARGPEGLEYPWGNEWRTDAANIGGDPESEMGVMPVGSFPAGRSPYGVYDMAGNVMEWVADWYGPYPGSDYVSKDFGKKFKVVRGGGWGGVGHYALRHFYRTAYRFYLAPESRFNDLGFRCAKDAPS